ncbi:hypothetical protein BDW69DRAFT_187975 [Aspergillus filifer]
MSSSENPDTVFSLEGLNQQLGLLASSVPNSPGNEAALAPIIAGSVLRDLQGCQSTADETTSEAPPQLQYGLLAASSAGIQWIKENLGDKEKISLDQDPRLFFNITPPSSTFICGSQGSGKSHTLSCMLEACLIASEKLGNLSNPLAGVVFHYDTFTSDVKGQPCEAAYLASNEDIEVRVLCAPTNVASIKRTYAGLNVTIEALRIDQNQFNTKRMMDLMAVSGDDTPLYMESIKRILREMRIIQQTKQATGFNYRDFKRRVDNCGLTPSQMGPLTQRLDALESFMPASQTSTFSQKSARGTDWYPVPGRLTIVDLSCPCISPATACALFNICLAISLESGPDEETRVGRVVALDEAHKYMTDTPEAAVFTETILHTVRLQRHLGARIMVATQEPSVSQSLLDLCSLTIVHRFTSPAWLKVLKGHLAAAQENHRVSSPTAKGSGTDEAALFERIVRLKVGEALMFAPTAIVGVRRNSGGDQQGVEFARLEGDCMSITVRNRLTQDGGKSILSV